MKSNKLVILLLVLAFLLRLGFIFATRAYVHPETVEGGVIAHAIVTGQGFSFSSPHRSDYYPSAIQAPVFPILLAGFYYLFGENDNAHLVLMLFQSVLSVWLCYLIYQMGKIIFDEKTGLTAMAIAVVYPILIIYSGRALNTMTSIVTVAFYFYLLLKYTYAKKSDTPVSYKYAIYLGISAGIAVLSEPGMVGFFILFAIVYLIFFLLKFAGKINIQIPSFQFLVISGIVAILVVLPWTVRNYLVFHKFVPIRTMAGLNLWEGNNPNATGTDIYSNGRPMYDFLPPIYDEIQIPEPERDVVLSKMAKDFIRDNPQTAIKLFLKKCYYFWWFPPKEIVSPSAARYAQKIKLPFFFLLLCVLSGTILALKRKYYYAIGLFWLFFLSYMLIYGITHFGHFRYRAPIEPFLMIIASYFLIVCNKKFTKSD